MSEPSVAVYWDFENIHASVLEASQGAGSYRENMFKPQDAVVDVSAIVTFAAGVGRVSINRAYANWQWLSRYRDRLHSSAMDLIQLFPLGKNAKNGADIRMAIDAVEDLSRYPETTHVVLVTGDSDFVGLAQTLRRHGCQVIGIGAEESTSRVWAAACDQFVYYHSLMLSGGASNDSHEPVDVDQADIEQARRLLTQAIRRLARDSHSAPWVMKARIKPMMQRLDSTFDETALGFSSFTGLLANCEDLIERREMEHDHEFRLRAEISNPPLADISDRHPYEQLLKRLGWRLVDRPTLWAGLVAIEELVASEAVDGFAALDDLVARNLTRQGLSCTTIDAKKIRQVAFKSNAFSRGPTGEVALKTAPGELRHRVVEAAITRLDEHTLDDRLDPHAAATMLFSEPTTADRALVEFCITQVERRSGTDPATIAGAFPMPPIGAEESPRPGAPWNS